MMSRTRFVIAAWSVPAILSCGNRLAFAALGNGVRLPAWKLLVSTGAPWYAWAVMTPFIHLVTRRFPLRAPRRPGTLAAHLGACAASQFAYSAAYTLAAMLCRTLPVQYTPSRYLWLTTLGYLATMTLVYGAVVGVLEWRAADERARAQERAAAQLSAELALAQLSALRLQLHPHVLFNALNTIAVLVGEEQRETAMQLLAGWVACSVRSFAVILHGKLRCAMRSS